MYARDYFSSYSLSESRGTFTREFYYKSDEMGKYFTQNSTVIVLGDDEEEDGVAVMMKENGFLISVNFYKGITTRTIVYEKEGEVYEWILSKAAYEDLQKEGLTPSYIIDGWLFDGDFHDMADAIISNIISSLELIRLMDSEEEDCDEE